MIRFIKHILTSALPWNFRWYVWVLFGVWILIGVSFGSGGFSSSELIIPLITSVIYSICSSVALNIVARARIPLRKFAVTIFAGIFTLLSPLATHLGILVVMIPYFGGMGIYGEATNPPYSNCYPLPQGGEELKRAVASGFDVNGKCCLETMIGECIIITPDKRTTPYIYAVISSPQHSDGEVLEYLSFGADPTPGSLIEAASKRGEEVIKRLLLVNYEKKEYIKAYITSFINNNRSASLIRREGVLRFGEEDFKKELKLEIEERVYKGYSSIHYAEVRSNAEGLKQFVLSEGFMDERELAEAYLCSLLKTPRTVPHKTEETKKRYDLELGKLISSRPRKSALCRIPGSTFELSLEREATIKASNCESKDDCEAYRIIIRALEEY